jgi:hypothetical protein
MPLIFSVGGKRIMDDIKKITQAALAQAGVHSINIKGKTYTIELLPATQAFAVAIQLVKVALPTIGAIVDGTKKQDLILPEEDNLFTDAAVLLVAQMNNISVLDIVQLLTQKITLDGKAVNIDDEFKGNLGGLVCLLEFTLKENVGDFFTEYLQAKGISIQSLKDLMGTKEETTSPSEET